MKITRKWRRTWQRELQKAQSILMDNMNRAKRYLNLRKTTWKADWKHQLIASGIVACQVITSFGQAYAMPQDGQVVGGNGSIEQNGNVMNVNQSSNKMAVDWQAFNIAAGETVNFIQPNAQAVALNRVLGSDPSAIFGALNANGQVFLVNPNGIMFGSSAQVNVGALVASTLNMNTADFMAGEYKFINGSSAGSIISDVGSNIQTSNGGAVTLISPQISNNGIIVANEGSVSLVSGDKVTIGDNLIVIAVDESQVATAIANGGMIRADGGLVLMNAQTGSALVSTIINTGVVEAKSLVNKDGVISLVGGSGTVTVSGTIDASGTDTVKGGTINITGNSVNIASSDETPVIIKADGNAGGGVVNIGGEHQGSGVLAHANNVSVAAGVNISADALRSGDGGQVVVWSDDTADFNGNASAIGGELSGKGGAVEVTAQGRMNYNGTVDTQAVNGQTGQLMLEAADFNVAAENGNITAAKLGTALNANNVTISSHKLASDIVDPEVVTTGDLSVNDAVTWVSPNELVLNSTNSINVNQGIIAADNSTLKLNATKDVTATNETNKFANVNFSGETVAITGSTGLNLVGNNVATSTMNLITASGTIAGTGSLTNNGGTTGISANGTDGGISLSGKVDTNGQSLNLTSGSNNIILSSEDNNMGNVSVVSAKNVSIRSANDLELGDMTVAGTLSLRAEGSLTQNGTVNVAGDTTIVAGGTTTLGSANDFAGKVNLTSGQSTITDSNELQFGVLNTGDLTAVANADGASTGALNLGAGAVNGNLTATNATNGIITQGGALNIIGTSNITTNGGTVTLSSDNNFAGAVNVNTSNGVPAGANVIINDSTGGVILGNINTGTAGDLSIASTNGSITQAEATNLSIGGMSSLTAIEQEVSLNNDNDFVGTVSLTSGAAQIKDINALTLGSLNTGNLSVMANADGESTGSANLGNGTINGSLTVNIGTSGYVAQTGALNVAGSSTFNTKGGSINLASDNNFVGAVTLNVTNGQSGGANVTLKDKTGTLVLGNVNTGTAGNLALISSGGSITQSEDTTVIVGGKTVVSTSGSDVILNGSNNFVGAVAVNTAGEVNRGADILLKDSSDGLVLGNINSGTAGKLVLTSTDGAITQSGSTIITVGGPSVISAAGEDVTLNNGNNFNGKVSVTADVTKITNSNDLTFGALNTKNLTVTVNSGGLEFDESNINGNLQVTTNGNLRQNGNVKVSGNTTFAVGKHNNITLNKSGNDFNYVTITNADNVNLVDTNKLILSASTVSGDLRLTTNGDINQNGVLKVSGNTILNAGGHDVSLTNTGNIFAGSVAVNDVQDVSFRYKNGTDFTFAESSIKGDLSVIGSGSIKQKGSLEVAGTMSLAAGKSYNISLGDDSKYSNKFHNVIIQSGRNVELSSDSKINFGQSTVYGNLNVISQKGITQGGYLTVSGKTVMDAGAWHNVTLNNRRNQFAGGIKVISLNTNLACFGKILLTGAVVAGTLALVAGEVEVGMYAVEAEGAVVATSVVAEGVTGAMSFINEANVIGEFSSGTVEPPPAPEPPPTPEPPAPEPPAPEPPTPEPPAPEPPTPPEPTPPDPVQPESPIDPGDKPAPVPEPEPEPIVPAEPVNPGYDDDVNIFNKGNIVIKGGYYLKNLRAETEDGKVTQSGLLKVDGNLTVGSGRLVDQGIDLFNLGNDFNSVTVTHGHSAKIYDKNSIVLNRMEGLHGAVLVKAGEDIIQRGIVDTVHEDILLKSVILSAGANYKNESGIANPIKVLPGSHWVIASASPDDQVLGGMTEYDYRQYNVKEPTLEAEILHPSMNGLLYTVDPTLSVTMRGTIEKVYDGTTDSDLKGASFSSVKSGDVLNGDEVSFDNPTKGSFDNKNAGQNKTVTADLSISAKDSNGKDVYGYQGTATGDIGVITPKGIVVAGITADNKVYDGTNNATVNYTNANFTDGIIAGDKVTLDSSAANGTFSDKKAGTGKTVTVSALELSGDDMGNYNLSNADSYTTNADITKKSLVVANVSADNKTYDRSTDAHINYTGAEFGDGLIAGDSVTIDGSLSSGSFENKTAGINKTVTVNGMQLAGADADNYSLSNYDGYTTTADINKLVLGKMLLTADSKVYDGTTAANINNTAGELQKAGVINGDTVTMSVAANFEDKKVAQGKTVNISSEAELGGTDGENYAFSDDPYNLTTTADIGKKSIALSYVNITAQDKIYDGTTKAETRSFIYSFTKGDVASGDQVALNWDKLDMKFRDKNVGNAKTVTFNMSLAGTDAENYTLTNPDYNNSSTASITKKSIAISGGITADNKIYDGTNKANVSYEGATFANGIIRGDEVIINGAKAKGTFTNKYAGENKTVTVSGLGVSGADSGNYKLSNGDNYKTVASIAKLELNELALTADSKLYDGNNAAVIGNVAAELSNAGIINGDDVSINPVATFTDKNAGNNKVVNIAAGAELSGDDAQNYMWKDKAYNTTTQADISRRVIWLTDDTQIKANDKVYDGNVNAQIGNFVYQFGGTEIIAGDQVSMNDISTLNGRFNDKNAAENKTVTVDLYLTGADNENYQLTNADWYNTTTAQITRKSVAVSNISADSKIYDGTTVAQINYTAADLGSGIVAGDIVTINSADARGKFSDKNAGNNKTVTVDGMALSGTDEGNYYLSNANGYETNASIYKRTLSELEFKVENKVYDGGKSAKIMNADTVLTSAGAIVGDKVSISATADFADKSAALAKTVSINNVSELNGSDAANYNLNDTPYNTTAVADIVRKPINITYANIQAKDKVYDGSTSASVRNYMYNFAGGGLVEGDKVTLNNNNGYLTGTFSDKNAGNNKTVIVDLWLSGADGGNYVLNNASAYNHLKASITPQSLTVTGITAANKVADGNVNASINYSDANLGNGIVRGDAVVFNSSAAKGTFSDASIGNGKTVTVKGMLLSGNDAANYVLTNANTYTTVANIVKRPPVRFVLQGMSAGEVYLNDIEQSGIEIGTQQQSRLLNYMKNVDIPMTAALPPTAGKIAVAQFVEMSNSPVNINMESSVSNYPVNVNTEKSVSKSTKDSSNDAAVQEKNNIQENADEKDQNIE